MHRVFYQRAVIEGFVQGAGKFLQKIPISPKCALTNLIDAGYWLNNCPQLNALMFDLNKQSVLVGHGGPPVVGGIQKMYVFISIFNNWTHARDICKSEIIPVPTNWQYH